MYKSNSGKKFPYYDKFRQVSKSIEELWPGYDNEDEVYSREVVTMDIKIRVNSVEFDCYLQTLPTDKTRCDAVRTSPYCHLTSLYGRFSKDFEYLRVKRNQYRNNPSRDHYMIYLGVVMNPKTDMSPEHTLQDIAAEYTTIEDVCYGGEEYYNQIMVSNQAACRIGRVGGYSYFLKEKVWEGGGTPDFNTVIPDFKRSRDVAIESTEAWILPDTFTTLTTNLLDHFRPLWEKACRHAYYTAFELAYYNQEVELLISKYVPTNTEIFENTAFPLLEEYCAKKDADQVKWEKEQEEQRIGNENLRVQREEERVASEKRRREQAEEWDNRYGNITKEAPYAGASTGYQHCPSHQLVSGNHGIRDEEKEEYGDVNDGYPFGLGLSYP